MENKTVKDVKELTDQQNLFLFYLEQIKNPANRDEINHYLHNWGYALGDCQLRALKRDLIERGYAIGSSRASGYFLIREGDDGRLQEALEEGRRHIRGNARINALIKRNAQHPNTTPAKKPAQPVLFKV